jgi:hypothetical protein
MQHTTNKAGRLAEAGPPGHSMRRARAIRGRNRAVVRVSTSIVQMTNDDKTRGQGLPKVTDDVRV